MVLIFNSTVSREISGTNFTRVTSRASEASETLSSLNNKNQRYMSLASERREYQYILNEE